MQRSARRYRSLTSNALVCAVALGLALASLASPGRALAADAKKPATAAPESEASKSAAEKSAREKQNADAKAARDAKRAKKRAAKAREDQDDITAKRPWVNGANWLVFRAGVAAASKEGRPNPGPGFGFGYQHFTSRRWATGLEVDYDLLGKYAGAAEIEVPFHLERIRHYDWGDAMRPYLGLSVGGTWHRTYRTGGDEAEMRPSLFFVTGANLPIAPRSLMGADFRVGWEGNARSSDPVFPNDSNSLLTWRLKLAYLRWQ